MANARRSLGAARYSQNTVQDLANTPRSQGLLVIPRKPQDFADREGSPEVVVHLGKELII